MTTPQLDKEITAFLSLLSACVHGTSVPALDLTAGQWRAVMSLGRAHNVLALVFEKASENEDFTHLPEYPRYASFAMRIVAEQVQRTEAFLAVYQELLKADLHPIVMKGILCRQLYGEYSDHRASGDEDLWIRQSDYEAVKDVLVKNGYLPGHEELAEHMSENHFNSIETGLSLDVHWNLIGGEEGLRGQMNDCFQNVFSDCREVEIGGVPVATMSHTDHLLFLVLHAFKHFTAGGFGIRQILDILRYAEEYGTQCDWDHLRSTLEAMNAWQFLADLFAIGNQYLGFRFEGAAAPTCPGELLQEVLGCGVFGNTSKAQVTAGGLVYAAVFNREDAAPSKPKRLLRAAFPARANMVATFPELRDHPGLLPICWVKRWIRFLARNRMGSGQAVAEGIKLSQKRIELLKKYDIL